MNMKPTPISKSLFSALGIMALTMPLLSGCSSKAQIPDGLPTSMPDGSYVGKSSPDDTGAYAEVTLVFKNQQLENCTFVTIQEDGSIKDQDYGKINGEISNSDYYDKAQLAVQAMQSYAQQYQELKDLREVDAISGATIAYNQFVEAVQNALT
jgi:major membrane immunogen (membrane-anchored lipoprotein)